MATVRVNPGYIEQILAHTLTELAARQSQEEEGSNQFQSDIVDWTQRHYFIPSTMDPMKLYPHQIGLLRYMFTRREDHHFPAQTLIYSTVKKSGKTAIGAVAGRYMAEAQTHYGDIFCCGNDLTQAKEREFMDIRRSLELTPGYDKRRDVLPGRWAVRGNSMTCMMTGSRIRPVSVDAKGEAGGAAALSVFTELWGFDTTDAKRFWEEMTPAPTIQDSMRLVETYAGFDDGSSELLWNLYQAGLQGRQLTAGELSAVGARENVPGQTFQDLVDGWQETKGDPEVLVPVWHNEQAGIIMYWDSGLIARRMPWQQGDQGARYYREQEASQPPDAYRRHHLNEWTGSESPFIPVELWDRCGKVHDIEPLNGKRTQLVVAMDAAVSGDCFGVVALSRCPIDKTAVDVRDYRVWNPKDSGGRIDFTQPEAYVRSLCEVYNVVQVCYDPFQLEDMAQRMRRDAVGWIEQFTQGAERLKADSQLYDLIMQERIHHSNQGDLREHIANANAKLQPAEDSKLRIVKKDNGRKIDLAVCMSMGSSRNLYLLLD